MPVQSCQINNENGFKWGEQGKCYTGPGAKKKALEQGIAIGEYEFAKTYNDYPKAASENAKRALDWIDEYGRDVVKAGTLVGLARANQLSKREAITRDTIARMAAFNRHRENSKIDPKFEGTPWKDKGYVAWLLWGGTEGVDWAIRKLKQIDSEKTDEKYLKVFFEGSQRISFDYDDTLSTQKGEEKALDLIKQGKDVYIITRRNKALSSSVYAKANKLGIPSDRVHFTEGKLKWSEVEMLKIDIHYDNNQNEVDKINELTNAQGILFK
jgi:hypothetical protein